MLTIYTSTSVSEAKGYYIEGKTQEAYYTDGQEFTGSWVGKAASRLGLKGKVDSESFVRLCENRHPDTGEPLTARMSANRRVAYDCTFGVPKSVSLAWAYTGDDRIIRAARQAAHDVVTLDMQPAIATRVRKNGQDKNRTTGELVAAEFTHLTARPVGKIPDPHIHVHMVLLNATYDSDEEEWKAVQFGDVWDDADAYGKMFLARLAQNLKKLGLEIIPNEKSFEIAGVTRELNKRFSRRTTKIEETAQRLGITDPEVKATLASLTREPKTKTLLIPELRKIWVSGFSEEDKKPFKAIAARLQRSRAKDLSEEITLQPEAVEPGEAKAEKTSELLGRQKTVKGDGKRKRQSQSARTKPQASTEETVVEVTKHDRRAVAFAIKHLFERQSVATENQIIEEAFKGWSLGLATLPGVRQVMAATPLVRMPVNGKMMMTTPEVMEEEDRLIENCLNGKWRHEELNPDWKIEDEKLNEQQRGAVKHVLTSRDWVVGIAGKAGAGKTRLLIELRLGVEAGMHKFFVFAPTAEASRETLPELGFSNAETVAKLLSSERLQKEAQGAVWLIDEAGMLSTRQADRIFTLAKKLGARLVLIGDTGQHHSVERGQAFDLLAKFAHMSVAHVEEIQRQKGLYKKYVELVAAKKIEEAFAVLEQMDAVKEMTLEERKVAIAADYIHAIERKKTALVVAPTHVECENVTEGIRASLKEKKMITGGAQWDILRDLSWTEAQKEFPHSYQTGQVVKFNRHVNGFALGERVEVIDVRDEEVRVRSKTKFHDRIKKLPLGEAEKFNVYEKDQIEICEGERIRITLNSRTADRKRVSNGNHYNVDYVDHKGRIVLENGFIFEKDFPHLEYGYTTTSHASQSKSVDCVFVAQTAALSLHASDLAQLYVSTSRGKEELKMYVDNLSLLKENVSRERKRQMATELFYGSREESDTAEVRQTSKFLGQQKLVGIEGAAEMINPPEAMNVLQSPMLPGSQDKHKLTLMTEAELGKILRTKQEEEMRRAQRMAMAR